MFTPDIQSRRSFVKTAALGGGAALGAGLLAGSRPASVLAAPAADGCFVGHGIGARGDVSAYVVIADGRIESVVPGESLESEGPGTSALKAISQKVVEAQSINVDGVSGATLTSTGYLSAIRDAVDAAGMTEAFDVPAPAAEEAAAPEGEYDAIIVGAGGAGLMAAMTLAYPTFDNVKSDVKAIVFEKCDIAGGSTQLSYGGCAVGDGLRANDVMDHHVSPDEMVDLLVKRNTGGVNEPLARAVFEKSPDTVASIAAFGGPYATNYTGSVKTYSGYTYLQMDANLNQVLADVDKANLGSFTNQGGYALAHFLETKVRQSGTEIRYGAEVTGLIVEDGAVVGVHVAQGASEYDVRAKNVVLACGGFTQSAEYMGELCGELVPSYVPWCGAGSTGDAFRLTEGLGATRVGEGALVYFSLDAKLGMYSNLNNTYRKRQEIIVDEAGARLADESQDEYYIAYGISQAQGGHAFAVIDADNPNVGVFEQWVERGKVFKADTLEELAEAAGIDAAGLAQTVAAYNDAYDAGEDAELGTPHDAMYPVKNGPFYAGEISICVIGSLVGLKVNENCQILGEGDAPIDGLYGVGEVCLGGNILSMYYSGGCSIATALNTGRISAEHIAANL